MTEVNDTYIADTGKVFYKDGIKLGTKLWLGASDNIENYTEVDEDYELEETETTTDEKILQMQSQIDDLQSTLDLLVLDNL